ncbi:hypothetical protein Gdia_0654 [Gluconacetobacter diazotrophicus PA1 5]|uniref:hypothetical protein n=1 Tax=Gluconacetobacter diazotrophicus TaxID=33996 RepID=UPI000173B1AC|nr:hypothetical protein [Gluconacetobacter diazotrophicus]ACI50445.1 hypothetical protein Gdia_0654 [Gluconacetobacter diazotrophicus PA1 5]TWA98324.1 hypothetical protein FBZ86_14319 [Gluconacetobacter diazotrophicus]
MWQDTSGNGYLSPNAANASISFYAKGTGAIGLYGNIAFSGYVATPASCGSLAGSTGCFTFKDQNGSTHYVPAW